MSQVDTVGAANAKHSEKWVMICSAVFSHQALHKFGAPMIFEDGVPVQLSATWQPSRWRCDQGNPQMQQPWIGIIKHHVVSSTFVCVPRASSCRKFRFTSSVPKRAVPCAICFIARDPGYFAWYFRISYPKFDGFQGLNFIHPNNRATPIPSVFI